MQVKSGKFTKRLVSVILMVVMIFSVCIPATAETQKTIAPAVSVTELMVGETAALKVCGWNIKTFWTSADENVATVDCKGVVTAVAEGETTITAKSRSFFGMIKKMEFYIIVKPFEADVTIEIGEDVELVVDACGITTWTTDDESIAMVDNGIVTGISEGVATITATTAKKVGFFWFLGLGKTVKTVETFTVEVVAPEESDDPTDPEPPVEQPEGTFLVMFNSNGGSTVETQTIYEGDNAFRPAAPVKEGFVFGDWYVDEALTEKYDFSTPVTDNITLYASWTELDVIITLSAGQYTEDEVRRVVAGKVEYNIALESIQYSAVSATKTVSDYIQVANADAFSVELSLEDGETVFTVTVKTVDGSTFEKSITLKYDSGDTYDSEGTYDVEDERLIEIPVIEDNDGDGEAEVYLVSNILSLTFYPEVSFEDRKAFIEDTLGAEVAGYLNALDMMQALVVGELPLADELGYEGETNLENITEDELWEYCELLVEAYSEILEDFDLEYVYNDMTAAITINDSWDDGFTNADWWLEKIDAYEAWEYNSFFNNDYFRYITLGVVDSGFMDDHEDLTGRINVISKRDDAGDHGTHVAGIIGATANNGKGIAGVLYNQEGIINNGNIAAYDATSSDKYSDSQILEGLTTTVESGAKVINFSLGASENIPVGEYSMSNFLIKSAGKKYSKAIGKLLKNGYDFVVVQSAGNGNDGDVGVDYCNNLCFSSINESNCYDYQPLFGNNAVSKSDIMDRILIVSAIRSDNTLTYFSNGGLGDLNEIAAPGDYIYSTVADGGYDYYPGTSMAAPIVTAVCAMTWSINPALTGAEVVDMVMSNAVGTATKNDLSHTEGGMGIVNLLECTKAAIKSRPEYHGNVIDAVTGTKIEATVVIHKGDKNGPVVGEEQIYYTDYNGNFRLPELADLGTIGTYTFEIAAENYVTAYVTVDKFDSYNLGTIGLSPVMDDGKYRIVLHWGSVQPSDLDSHLVAESLAGERYHVFYNDMNPYPYYANLDLDDISYEGPETITIVNFADSKNIKYAIHDYSNRSSTNSTVMSNSGAYVQVFKGNTLLETFHVPQNVGGTEWVVFAFDASGRIIPINEMRYCESPRDVLAN